MNAVRNGALSDRIQNSKKFLQEQSGSFNHEILAANFLSDLMEIPC